METPRNYFRKSKRQQNLTSSQALSGSGAPTRADRRPASPRPRSRLGCAGTSARSGTDGRAPGRSVGLQPAPLQPSLEAAFPRASPEGEGQARNSKFQSVREKTVSSSPEMKHTALGAQGLPARCVRIVSPSNIQGCVLGGKYFLLLPKTEKPQGSGHKGVGFISLEQVLPGLSLGPSYHLGRDTVRQKRTAQALTHTESCVQPSKNC